MDLLHLLEAIIALFVIVDPIGNIPVFLSVTSGVPQEKRQRAFTISVAVAMGILLLFSFTGDVVLHRIFGIQIADLQIAGGILLVIMAIDDLVFGSQRRPKTADETLSADGGRLCAAGLPPAGRTRCDCHNTDDLEKSATGAAGGNDRRGSGADSVSCGDVLCRANQSAGRQAGYYRSVQGDAGLSGRNWRPDADGRAGNVFPGQITTVSLSSNPLPPRKLQHRL
jgi:hypothetical protein